MSSALRLESMLWLDQEGMISEALSEMTELNRVISELDRQNESLEIAVLQFIQAWSDYQTAEAIHQLNHIKKTTDRVIMDHHDEINMISLDMGDILERYNNGLPKVSFREAAKKLVDCKKKLDSLILENQSCRADRQGNVFD